MQAKNSKENVAIGAAALGAVAVGVVVLVIMIAAWRPSRSADSAPQTEPATKASPVAQTEPAPLVNAEPSVGKFESTVVNASVTEPSEPTTITGCLQTDDESFVLKDTDLPKSRSWKSGFLKKRSANVDVLDSRNRLRLANFVGQRVKVTGMLVEREMQARSLERVATSCK